MIYGFAGSPHDGLIQKNSVRLSVLVSGRSILTDEHAGKNAYGVVF